ncbi:MAG: Zn-ribbon domain-containing OB-fold protein [Chloroflexota bacterium]|nr:Zn-ribbon domain-containing OB-fold protein [Chloroflexota bacterium]
MSLLHRIEHTRDALTWEGDMPTQGRYTVGIAGEKFFREIKDNSKFLGTVCPTCGITYVPPRLYCERCFAHLEEWVEVPITGMVYTFTTVHLDLDGNRLPEPRIMAFVRLDGTDGGLVHYLDGVEPNQVCIGMPVEAVFKKKADRQGSILDIEYFKPLERR